MKLIFLKYNIVTRMPGIMKWTFPKYKFFMVLMAASFSIFVSSCHTRDTHTAEQIKLKETWTCSMHPEIIRDGPGSCPICGMDLVKKEEKSVAVTGIELDDLLRPVDQFIVSTIPVITIQHQKQELTVDVLGSVTYDTRQINMISARVSGRIEKLYVRYRYQHIHKGDKVMDVYSPQLATAQQELLFLIKNDPGNESLINSAKQKLLLLGMNEEQLTRLIRSGKASPSITIYSNYSGHLHEAGNTMPATNEEKIMSAGTMEELPVKEGMSVSQGQNIFQIFNTDNIWVLLNIFPEAQSMVKPGDPVIITPETDTSMKLGGKIDFIEPLYRAESKTITARVYLNNSKGMIPIGSQVRARIFTGMKITDWLPKEAVLSLGLNKIVFLKKRGGFQAHPVETGFTYQNQVQIISGLDATDSVAANGQYLADSESFISIKKQK
jgi:membrane fusion protein, copper/silver efflux system